MIVGELPARDREVIMLRYEKDFSLSEIGKVIGVTESRLAKFCRERWGGCAAALTWKSVPSQVSTWHSCNEVSVLTLNATEPQFI